MSRYAVGLALCRGIQRNSPSTPPCHRVQHCVEGGISATVLPGAYVSVLDPTPPWLYITRRHLLGTSKGVAMCLSFDVLAL